MNYGQYKFKFYLNANHSIYIDGKLGQNHPHTWEFIIETIKVKEDFVQFDYIEKEVDKLFSTWQNTYINSVAPFDVLNPTLENICIYFRKVLSELLETNGWLLTRMEVSESPSRSYIIDITDEVLENDEYVSETAAEIDADNLVKSLVK